jgi:hypothetical protein
MKTARAACALFLTLPLAALSWQQSVTPPASPQSPVVQETGRSVAETQRALHDLACGPEDVHHRRWTESGPQTLPPQPPDKALIYVVRPTHYGAAMQTKLAVDRKWMGVNRVNSYFYFTLSPGPHYFCSELKNTSPSLLSLVVDGGKTYYLQQKIGMDGNFLRLLDEEEGKKSLAKCRLSLSEEKK